MNKSNRSKVERYIIDVGMRRSLGFDRKTIRKYVALAQRVGVRQGESFPEESDLVERLEALTHSALLRQRPAQELIGPHQHLIEKWLENKRMTAKQIWRLFREETGLSVSYSTMKRYLRSRFDFGAPRVTVRLEVGPAEQAQVDFGYVGMMVDPSTGKTRRTWALIMSLSYSRHRFVRFVFRQDVPTWIDCHVQAERPGAWVTDPSDHPPDMLAYLMFTPRWCRTKAADIGPQTETLIKKILSHHAMRSLKKAQAILRLAQKYGKQRMEAACQRSLDFGNLNYRSIKAILEKGLDQSPQTPPVSVSPLSSLGLGFLRALEYFAPTKEVAP